MVAGARPNFIKLAPVARAIEKAQKEGSDIAYTLVYAGRKDDPTLEDSLFDDLQMMPPTVFLGVDCENLNELTGRVMSKFETYLQENKTDAVIVVDDLASTMACAIVTKKQGITLAHLSAGTRSFDINMPKEINRLVIDGLSDILFTAGISNNSIANREGAELSKVYMVGNILMDTLRFNYPRFVKPVGMSLDERAYIVFTLNRKALMADREKLSSLLSAMIEAAGDMPVVAPLRPSAARLVREIVADMSHRERLHFAEPMSYLEFGWLTANAAGIITDSGNVAEEATFNGVPCITLNSYTEHIETVKQGTNVLVGEDPKVLADNVSLITRGEWKKHSLPDRWDGRSAERIVRIITDYKD